MSSCPVGRYGDPSYSSRTAQWAFCGFPSALPCVSVYLCVNWAVGSGPGRSAGHAHKQSHRLWAHGTSKRSSARAQPFCYCQLVIGFHRVGERPAFPRPAALSACRTAGTGWFPSEVRVFASCHGISLRNCLEEQRAGTNLSASEHRLVLGS